MTIEPKRMYWYADPVKGRLGVVVYNVYPDETAEIWCPQFADARIVPLCLLSGISVNVYVPAVGAKHHLIPGSAIVGEVAPHGLVNCCYEGRPERKGCMVKWQERLHNAFGRLVCHAPTIARATFAEELLVKVGTYDGKVFHTDVENEGKLVAWLAV